MPRYACRATTFPSLGALLLCGLLVGCEAESRSASTNGVRAEFDAATGRLYRAAYDEDKNGTTDTWMYMDGARVLRVETDADENGLIERWEYYDEAQQLERVALARGEGGEPNRWERYEDRRLVDVSEDGDGDGRPERWQHYRDGVMETVSFDEDRDGTPDRRLTYDRDGMLVSIESEPDAEGIFLKTVRLVGHE